MPETASENPLPRLGLELRESSGDEGGESGGAGSLVVDLVLRPLRPDSSMYGVTDDRRRPALSAISCLSSSSICTSFISSLTPCSGGMA